MARDERAERRVRLAPAFLAAYFSVALISPAICKALNRDGLIALALLPACHHRVGGGAAPRRPGRGFQIDQHEWVPSLSLSIDLRLDALSMIMTLVIAGIGTLVLLYSARYFPDGDEGLGRYSGSLIAFAGAMLGLVWANNLILLVIFWELTGILSYLLIAHRTGKRSSRMAASQALMVTTAGGLVMLVGAVMLGVTAGTFTISEIIANPPSGPVDHYRDRADDRRRDQQVRDHPVPVLAAGRDGRAHAGERVTCTPRRWSRPGSTCSPGSPRRSRYCRCGSRC